MVKEKDLNSIQNFGGIEGIAEALSSEQKENVWKIFCANYKLLN